MSKWQDAGFPDNVTLQTPLMVINSLTDALNERLFYKSGVVSGIPEEKPKKLSSFAWDVGGFTEAITIDSNIEELCYRGFYFPTTEGYRLGYDIGKRPYKKAVCELLGIPYVPLEHYAPWPKFSTEWALCNYRLLNAMRYASVYEVPRHDFFLGGAYSLETQDDVLDVEFYNSFATNSTYLKRPFQCYMLKDSSGNIIDYGKPIDSQIKLSMSFAPAQMDIICEIRSYGNSFNDFSTGLKEGENQLLYSLKNTSEFYLFRDIIDSIGPLSGTYLNGSEGFRIVVTDVICDVSNMYQFSPPPEET